MNWGSRVTMVGKWEIKIVAVIAKLDVVEQK